MKNGNIAAGKTVSIRKIEARDLETIAGFEYSVSILEPHASIERLTQLFETSAMWQEESGAVAIIENDSSRMVGTLQFYRSAPCIHGLEIGYVIHNPDQRRKGYAGEALRLLSDYLFLEKTKFFRQQLLIEVWNTASWKVAERSGFLREGILRSCGFGEGDPADCFVYSRTRKDYVQEHASSNGDK